MKDKINSALNDHNMGEVNLIDTLAVNKESLIFRDSVSGEVLDKKSLAKEIADAKDDKLPKAIEVDIEATHSGVTKNYTEYIPEHMEKSAESWTTPYEKPVLLGHDQRGITLGRVKSYEYGTSKLNPEKKTIKLTLEITNPDSIRRHLDGTALTYSIGAHAKQIHCSICGIDILNSDNWCGHWKGDKYKVKRGEGEDSKEEQETCIWKIGDMEYVEVSEVNVPADVWAQKLDVRVKEENKVKDSVDNEDDSNLNDNELFDNIDKLIQDNDTSSDNTTTEEEDNKDKTNEDINNDNMTDDVKVLNKKLEKLESDKNELAEKLGKITSDNESLNSDLNETKEKLQNSQKINIELSKHIKKVYTESIINAKIRLEELTEKDVQDETDKLLIMGVRELSEMLTNYNSKEKEIPKSIPKIDQSSTGALGIHQKNVDSENSKKEIKKKNPITAKDAVNGILDN
jgi:hypothetical protein